MGKYRTLAGVWRWIGILFTVVILVLAVNRTFDFRFFVGYALCDHIYYYLTVALLLPLAFLYVPVKTGLKESWQMKSFFIDLLLALLAFGISIYFAWNALTSVTEGWARVAPVQAVIMAVALWLLVVESVRRASGQILGIIV